MTKPPSRFIITDSAGNPKGVVDGNQLDADCLRLMSELATAAGDDRQLDAIGCRWSREVDPDYLGYVSAGALSLMVRCVVAPLLEAVDTLRPDLEVRTMLAENLRAPEQGDGQ